MTTALATSGDEAFAAAVLALLIVLGLLWKFVWNGFFPLVLLDGPNGTSVRVGRSFWHGPSGSGAALWVRWPGAGGPPWRLTRVRVAQATALARRYPRPFRAPAHVSLRRAPNGDLILGALEYSAGSIAEESVDTAAVRAWEGRDLDRKALLARMGAEGNLALQRARLRRHRADDTVLPLPFLEDGAEGRDGGAADDGDEFGPAEEMGNQDAGASDSEAVLE